MIDTISWILLVALAALLVAAAVVDLKKREIPHWVVIAMAVLSIPFWWSTGLSLWPDVALQLGVAMLVLVLFTLAFMRGWMGGGDVKLVAALALWLPWQAVIGLIIIMSFAGGALTVGTIIYHRMKKASGNPEIPYGVAIAFAGIWLIGQRFLNQFG